VNVSPVWNRANTIQYIIHLVCEKRRGARVGKQEKGWGKREGGATERDMSGRGRRGENRRENKIKKKE